VQRGDGIDESFTAQMIVSADDFAPDAAGIQDAWIQGVGRASPVAHFSPEGEPVRNTQSKPRDGTSTSGRKDMHIGHKFARVPVVLAVVCLSFAAGHTSVASASDGSMNGAAGQMPAFYDGELFTVNMKEMPDNASDSLRGSNMSINTIYASNDLDEEQEFTPVIDAIQGDGFNPLWDQVLIVFNEGFTPHQFVSDEQVLAAAAGPNPEITLVETGEVYRCSVVGPK
jgi:hypothetical protein